MPEEWKAKCSEARAKIILLVGPGNVYPYLVLLDLVEELGVDVTSRA